ncbi:MAG TPA: DUF4132 domain-containing protein [Sphingomicrobium sp.]
MDFLRRLAGLIPAVTVSVPKIRAMPDVADLPANDEPQRIVRTICDEAISAMQGWQAKFSDSKQWEAVKSLEPELQVAVAMAALDQPKKRGIISYAGNSFQVGEIRKNILSQLLRRDLPFTSRQLHDLLRAWADQDYSLDYGLPGRAMLGAVERHAEREPLDRELAAVLQKLLRRARENYRGGNKFHQQIGHRIEKLIDPDNVPNAQLPPGAFGAALSQWAATLPGNQGEAWLALAVVAAEAGDKSKPSAKWLGRVKPLVDRITSAEVARQLGRWIEETTLDPQRSDQSLDVLKGMLWLSPQLEHGEMAGQVGRFAEKCFRKVPGMGARSVKLGNASLWALSEMAGESRAAAELFRLKEKIKYPSARKVIDNRLAELATKTGQSVEAMEDVALPDFGLDDESSMVCEFGDARAELRVTATQVVQQWFGAGDKLIKSIPSEARTAHAAELGSFKQTAKEIEAARAAQVLRLEQSWIEERSWTFATWEENFLRHPLRRPIVQSVIWRIGDHSLIAADEALRDVSGRKHAPKPDDVVRLWHPLDSQPEEVLAWRGRILNLGLTQPIKQAHREIYVLTDAERQTRVYSNRFAAHILRQHQFRALCQARGWQYVLMGDWDGWNVPTLSLSEQGLRVEYQVETIDDGQRSESGVSMHLASDQVRFFNAHGETVELDEIAPVVFSEVLRDVDLFVAVTSVANDPGWTDGGPDGRFGGYWREWAFGDLGQSARTRKELIAWIAPKLSIADKLEIGDKSLIVQGKRQKYAIHFGSGNIQILPSNRYLCIVQDRAPQETANLRLPFSGDNLLSTILAKAFLLVDEDKIKDATIISQL